MDNNSMEEYNLCKMGNGRELTKSRKQNSISRILYVCIILIICTFILIDLSCASSINVIQRRRRSYMNSDVCPNQCSCLDTFIDCAKLGLHITPNIPNWVESLELSSNKLEDSIGIKNLTNLKNLKLNKNRLRRMPILTELESLETLSLSHNKIEIISLDALLVLPKLKQLDLSKNYIKNILPNSFPAKNMLTVINLNFNQIANIAKQALEHLRFLHDLRLNNNFLTTLTKETFQNMVNLKRLQINNNRLDIINALTFQSLVDLQVLKLRNNRIRHLMDGAFHGLNNISLLELDNNLITSIAKRWLFNLTSLTTLSLANNSITHVELDGWEFVHHLTNLDLSNNNLQVIQKSTFEGLTRLRKLSLQNNRVTSIAEGAFRGTPNLKTLDLSDNEISWTIEDMNAPFSGLNKLEKFYLGSNRIKSINQNAFVGLTSLEVLDLSNNNISSIQHNAFEKLVHLKDLTLNTTTLLCDCNLRWFFNWIKNVNFPHLYVICGYPVWLRGKQLYELNDSNLTCSNSPKPQIIEEPQSLLALKDSNLTMSCTATSSSSSPMSFQWKRDNVELSQNLFTVQINRTTDDNSTLARSELKLINVTMEHVGKYQCVVTNNYGATYSHKNKITVGTYPTFRKIPNNVTVNAGSTARLDCAASGEPRPQIAWQKDGGNDFPAARERRMHVMPEDDAFFIINAQTSDMGLYSCTAENAAGIIKANATLIVLESPSFVKTMENKEVTTGISSVLECMASGSPKPQLSWTKDGNPIEVTERHFFAAEDQLLIIVDTTMADAGTYECEMKNDLGIERGYMKLKVTQAKGSTAVNVDDMLGIVIITVVCCAVGTSLIWVVIIYQTKKRATCKMHHPHTSHGNSNRLNYFNAGDLAVNVSDLENKSLVNNVNGHARNLNSDCDSSSGRSTHILRLMDNQNFVPTPATITTIDTSDTIMSEEYDENDQEDQSSCKDSGTGDSAKHNSINGDCNDGDYQYGKVIIVGNNHQSVTPQSVSYKCSPITTPTTPTDWNSIGNQSNTTRSMDLADVKEPLLQHSSNVNIQTNRLNELLDSNSSLVFIDNAEINNSRTLNNSDNSSAVNKELIHQNSNSSSIIKQNIDDTIPVPRNNDLNDERN